MTNPWDRVVKRESKKRPSAEWTAIRKGLKGVIEHVGVPAATFHDSEELKVLIDAKEAKRQEERLKERGTLAQQNPYVTDAAKECLRQLFFAYTQTPVTDPPDTASRMAMELGNQAEEKYIELYREAGFEVETQERVEFTIDGVLVSGRMDFFFVDDIPVEVKATQASKFMWTVLDREAGKEGHRRQLNLYLHYLNDFGANVKYPKGKLRYVITDAPKGTNPVFAYWIDYDKAMADDDLARIAAAWKQSQAGNDPGIPPAVKKEGDLLVWPCLYCNWRSICKAELNEMKKGAA